ncbi:AMP-binding protein [Roseomonas eburnea]|uniref:AMP-binding protein n=1 Tax=Neoroseomonas eburnea TaxID=1346889 RepID=A0A9X9X931_9PROT|nr:AMP-binding protein [Neoroseomonas eburnea]MBR0680217.1 AMP-binding protein [Neoroseomonas eburnea]
MAQIARWAREAPDKIAAHFPDLGISITFGELDARANRAAQWLISLGLEPGDGVALLMDNRPEFIELVFACRRAGLYYTPLSVHLRPQEVAYMLGDAGAKAIIVSPGLAELATALLREGATGEVPRFAIGEGLPRYGSYEAALAAFPAPTRLPERPVGREFLYSSGTTGLPKGIKRPLLSWENRNTPDWDTTWKSIYGFGPDTVYLSPAPLYHAAPHGFTIRRTIAEGGTAVVMAKFDPLRALELIERYRVTHSQWVPTMFVRLLALPEADRMRFDLSSHRCAIHAAAPCPVGVKRRMMEWWGPILWEYYAGSESVGTTVVSPQDWLARPGTVGRPVNGVKLHICDDDGNELPVGEVGRICFEGAPRFAYHNAPEKTAAAYNARGWASLGDLGRVDEEGWLFLSDRRADLILSGGVNLYPAEIEAALARHPEVAEVAVVGIPNEDFGEQVHAVIVPRDPRADTRALQASLEALCKEHLAGPKRPRSWEFAEELPRSEAGKLLRRILKERYLKPA